MWLFQGGLKSVLKNLTPQNSYKNHQIIWPLVLRGESGPKWSQPLCKEGRFWVGSEFVVFWCQIHSWMDQQQATVSSDPSLRNPLLPLLHFYIAAILSLYSPANCFHSTLTHKLVDFVSQTYHINIVFTQSAITGFISSHISDLTFLSRQWGVYNYITPISAAAAERPLQATRIIFWMWDKSFQFRLWQQNKALWTKQIAFCWVLLCLNLNRLNINFRICNTEKFFGTSDVVVFKVIIGS